MKTVQRVIGGTLAGLLLSAHGYAADAKNGQELHDGNCKRCHGTQVYTRADRKVTNLDKLNAQVRRCDSALGTKWFEEDIDDVVEYLNTQFYKF